MRTSPQAYQIWLILGRFGQLVKELDEKITFGTRYANVRIHQRDGNMNLKPR
jgi:hypothetical protein